MRLLVPERSCLEKRWAVPSDQPAADQPGQRGGERLGAIVGGERVGLVGQEHQVGAGTVQLDEVDLGLTLRVSAVDVLPAESSEPIAGERATTHDHPGIPPDRHCHPGCHRREGAGPPRAGSASQMGRGQPSTSGRRRVRRTPRTPAGRSRSATPTPRLRHRASGARRARGSPRCSRRPRPARAP